MIRLKAAQKIVNLRNKIDFTTLSPLAFLLFLFATGPIKNFAAGEAIHPDIATYKYFSIPLIGFSLGSVVFLGVLRKDWGLPSNLSNFLRENTWWIVVAASVLFTVFFSTVLILRYTSLHTSVIELGGYDNKVWLASSAIPSFKSIILASTGHFQPVLILYALFYRIYASPVILLALQVVTVASGVVPLYLMARDILKDNIWVLLVVVLYLLYPPVEFNSVADFHPDHLYIPLSLWAFYFALKGSYWIAVLMIGLGALAKEPFLLGASFFGIYLLVAMKRYFIGISAAVFFFLLFLLVLFYIQPLLSPYLKELQVDNLLQIEVFSHIGKLISDPNAFLNGVTNGLTRKLLFFSALLFPFLLLPLLSWKEFLPAIPLFAIPFLSAHPDHSNIECQYTAGIISPLFVAFIFSLEKIRKTWEKKHVNAVLSFVTILIITFNFSQSPSPLSINFWSSRWSETWNRNMYKSGEHEKVIKEAILQVAQDPNKVVVSQTNINHKRLAHRYSYWAFPHRWEIADYIILDVKKPLMVIDHIDPEIYRKELQKLEKEPKFSLLFKKDGVLLYKKANKD